MTFGSGPLFVREACPVRCGTFSNILGLYLLDACSTPPTPHDNQKCLQTGINALRLGWGGHHCRWELLLQIADWEEYRVPSNPKKRRKGEQEKGKEEERGVRERVKKLGRLPRAYQIVHWRRPELVYFAHVYSVVSDPLWPQGLYPSRLFSMEFSRQEYWSWLPFSP